MSFFLYFATFSLVLVRLEIDSRFKNICRDEKKKREETDVPDRAGRKKMKGRASDHPEINAERRCSAYAT